jgi:hypothetical protein
MALDREPRSRVGAGAPGTLVCRRPGGAAAGHEIADGAIAGRALERDELPRLERRTRTAVESISRDAGREALVGCLERVVGRPFGGARRRRRLLAALVGDLSSSALVHRRPLDDGWAIR